MQNKNNIVLDSLKTVGVWLTATEILTRLKESGFDFEYKDLEEILNSLNEGELIDSKNEKGLLQEFKFRS